MIDLSQAAIVLISLVLGAGGALVFSVMGTRIGFADVPNQRSSHSIPVPKGGGIGILLAFVYVSVVCRIPSLFWTPVAVMSLVGLAADRFDLSPILRLIVQFSLALILFVAVDGVGYDLPGYMVVAFFWSFFILATANFFNFMDGINGIAGITGAVAFGFAGWMAFGAGDMGMAMVAMGTCAACLGFLPLNIPLARVFMGDVGSLLLGFLFGGFACYYSRSLADFGVFLAFLFPFYADAITTLYIRFREGENILTPHRRHLYQLLANEVTVKHWKIALIYGLVQTVTGMAVLMARNSGAGPVFVLLGMFSAVFVVVTLNLRRRIDSRETVVQNLKRQIFSKHIPLVLMTDLVLVMVSLWVACMFRFDDGVPAFISENLKSIFPMIVIIKLSVFSYFDLYRGMWRYTSISDLFSIIKASVGSTVLIVSAVLFVHGFEGFPRSVFVVDCIVTIILVGFFRLCVRFYYERMTDSFSLDDFSMSTVKAMLFPRKTGTRKRLLIIGAGNCGEKILREILNNPSVKYEVVGFMDDNPDKIGKKIHGVQVLNSIDFLESAVKRVQADELLIAIPSATAPRMKQIVDQCEESGLAFKTIPTMGELINGTVTVGAIRDVSFRDLLGRKPIELDQEKVGTCLSKRRILVTGAGGSIGSELCRQICRFMPELLIVVDWAETPLFEIDYELKRHFPKIQTKAVLADIQDAKQVDRLFKVYTPEVVFHAAAYKHVAMLEAQPWKAVLNNIFGTVTVVEAAKKFHVDRFVFVSTDKAVTPASVMGASKRIAEMYIQNQNCDKHTQGTTFMTVRFGNVAGSAGSVVPLFKKQIREGGPVTVTHPDVTRFFMTIPEACQLILQAGTMGNGREIFILEMGRPIKILDMARDIIRLYGYQPDVDIKIEFIGLRKGEKLFEELVSEGENVMPTDHKSILVLQSRKCSLDFINGGFARLYECSVNHDDQGIIREFQKILPDYTPSSVTDSFYPPN
ncbi:MAG: polysaccharide biosynthesis protein [Pseudomonadota bacterium]